MRRLVIIIILLLSLLLPAMAADVEAMQREALGGDELEQAVPQGARDILGDVSLADGLDLDQGLERIIDAGAQGFSTALGSALKRAGVLMAIVILCALVSSLGDTGLAAGPQSYINLAAVLAITAASVGSLSSFVGLGTETINDITLFSKALLPTLAAAMAATGKTLSASSMYVAACLFCDFFITLTDRLLVPMTYVFITASVAEAAVGGGMLGRIASLIKWLESTILKALLLCFTAYLSISGIVSGSADSVAVKAAKVALSGAVPVVGSIISDASETVLLSASILKNAVGVLGMLCILAVCAIPFVTMGVNYLTYKACGALAASLGGGTETKLIDAIGSALGMILAITAVCALMLLVSCVAAMRAVA